MGGRASKSKRAGIAEYVLEKTGNCKDMIDFLIGLVQGQIENPETGEVETLMASVTERKDAAKTLLEYGVGKPAQSVELDANVNQKATVVVVPLEVDADEWNIRAKEMVAKSLAEVSD